MPRLADELLNDFSAELLVFRFGNPGKVAENAPGQIRGQLLWLRPPLHGGKCVGSAPFDKMWPLLPRPAYRLPRKNRCWTMALGYEVPTWDSVTDPPQLPAEDAEPATTQSVYDQGNLLASPSELAIVGSEGILFQFWGNTDSSYQV